MHFTTKCLYAQTLQSKVFVCGGVRGWESHVCLQCILLPPVWSIKRSLKKKLLKMCFCKWNAKVCWCRKRRGKIHLARKFHFSEGNWASKLRMETLADLHALPVFCFQLPDPVRPSVPFIGHSHTFMCSVEARRVELPSRAAFMHAQICRSPQTLLCSKQFFSLI